FFSSRRRNTRLVSDWSSDVCSSDLAVSKERQVGIVPVEAVKWARPATGSERFKAISRVSQVLHPGDVVYVEPLNKDLNTYRLRPIGRASCKGKRERATGGGCTDRRA